jgi:hypothetical protein
MFGFGVPDLNITSPDEHSKGLALVRQLRLGGKSPITKLEKNYDRSYKSFPRRFTRLCVDTDDWIQRAGAVVRGGCRLPRSQGSPDSAGSADNGPGFMWGVGIGGSGLRPASLQKSERSAAITAQEPMGAEATGELLNNEKEDNNVDQDQP